MNYIQISGGIKPDYRTFAGKEIKKRAIKTMSAIPLAKLAADYTSSCYLSNTDSTNQEK